ncbi:hypothetical protein [Tropicibacter naphthalenivorans]|uniref:Uncharacterized protein n=1 Tax=Tropicibacter naphthalenivorans TaxID=441103 RepID=A0A0P1GKI3_9RHOB|nr:hypothetical protein [Tropicibacter naphthalenivorans]CUH82599.1 hypothetical protein TRN7648_04141 [Tropicibacter naphthalenivorans]SMD09566.1 hypothetical protein SAMN04488093_11932 [Tropicibacter naphthalenivorans]
MSKKFITGVIAIASLIATLSAAPARADNKDLQAFVGTAVTLFMLQQMLENNDRVKVRRYEPQRYQNAAPNKPRHYDGGNRRALLPAQCEKTVWGQNNKKRNVMTRSCLNNNFRAAKRLPDMCETRFWLNGKVRNGYNVSCLKGNGYTVARR